MFLMKLRKSILVKAANPTVVMPKQDGFHFLVVSVNAQIVSAVKRIPAGSLKNPKFRRQAYTWLLRAPILVRITFPRKICTNIYRVTRLEPT